MVRFRRFAYRTISSVFRAPYFESASATGINNKGQIIGTFEAVQSNGSVFNGSFLEQPDGTFIAIDPTNDTYVASISNNGYILGKDLVNGNLVPFVMNSSLQIIRTITDVPGANGYGQASLTSINSSGDIIGSYDSSYGAFITNVFTGEYTGLPSPKYCTAGGINDNGVVTGTCGLNYQGFVLTPLTTPVPEPSSIYVLLGTLAIGATLIRTIGPRRGP